MEHVPGLLKEGFYLTDGGLETTLIFHEGIELNYFAAFELLNNSATEEVLLNYFRKYLDIAKRFNKNFILESPTWRANHDWGLKLGYSPEQIRQINIDSIALLRKLQPEYPHTHMLLSGAIGPRLDGYFVSSCMEPQQLKEYHQKQIAAFAEAGADLVTAFTLNYSNEAIGIVQAAKEIGIPVVISFTLETDGRLPNGETLKEAIEQTDARTGNYTYYYMINCAHPDHFKEVVKAGGDWKKRIGGIRANASTKSHKELDESVTLDAGEKCKLAEGYSDLLKLLPNLRVIGGCCGTDHTHIEEVSRLLFQEEQPVLSAV